MMTRIISFLFLLSNLAFAKKNDGDMWNFQCTGGCVDVCNGFSKTTTDAICDGLACRCVCDGGMNWGSGDTCGPGRLAASQFKCFSSHTTADVKGKGLSRMNDIEVGDQVLTAGGLYKTIFSIDHRHPTKSIDFLQIHSSKQHEPLELTEKHMVFLEGNSNPVPAGSIRIGDRVQTLEGPSVVTKIDTINRDGLFSPLTTDGTIIASGIFASSYSAFLGPNDWIEIAGKKVVTHQDFFNRALKPYRYICTSMSLELCKTNNEKTAISKFAADLYDHVLRQSNLFQTVTLSWVIFMVYLIDFMLSPYSVALAVSSGIMYWRLSNVKN